MALLQSEIFFSIFLRKLKYYLVSSTLWLLLGDIFPARAWSELNISMALLLIGSLCTYTVAIPQYWNAWKVGASSMGMSILFLRPNHELALQGQQLGPM